MKYFKLLKLLVQSLPGFTLIVVILSIVSYMIPAVQVYYNAMLINTIIEKLALHEDIMSYFYEILPILSVIAVLFFFKKLNQMIRDPLKSLVTQQISLSVNQNILNKLKNIRLIDRETAEFHNQLLLANTFKQTFAQSSQFIISFIQSLVLVISLLGVVLTYDKNLTYILFISAIPSLLISFLEKKKNFQYVTDISEVNRIVKYSENLQVDLKQVQEDKIYGLSRYFYSYWQKYFKQYQTLTLKLLKSTVLRNLIGIISSVLGYGLCISYMLYKISLGSLAIGVYIPVADSISDMRNALSEAINCIGNIYQVMNYYDYYDRFMAMEEDSISQQKIDFEESIHFNDVSFHYLKQNKDALSHINCKIEARKTIAIVGENGSGKTTFTKLLMGLYHPSDGKVRIDGKDVEHPNLCDHVIYLSQYTTRLYLTIRENFTILNENITDEEIWEYLSKVGLKDYFSKLPHQLDTKLGKNIGDGEELSGGQWQRLAIARILSSHKKILILDEPTSALDPISEIEIFKMILKYAKDKTLIIISHRIGIARFCDEILVFENGQLVENGNHESLYKQKAHYFELFEMQRKMYEV